MTTGVTESQSDVETILGYPVTLRSLTECVTQIDKWLKAGMAGGPRWLACANPHSLEVARADAAFREALLSADLLIPDGVGMILASRILGGRIRARVTGSDIFTGVHRALQEAGGASVFFLGSSEENLQRVVQRMAQEFPRITVAGTYAPPFREDFTPADDDAMVAAVAAARPGVLWVGLTAPKQEKWIHRHRQRLAGVRFVGAVGAVFDFYTGRVRRSSPAFQRLGLEWLPRLLREPRRLWRRNFVSNPRFLLRVVAARLRRK